MDIEKLQANRTQLLYEFGEIEFEKRLFIQRLNELETEYDLKLKEIQKIESQINKFDESLRNFSDLQIFKDKNIQNVIESE